MEHLQSLSETLEGQIVAVWTFHAALASTWKWATRISPKKTTRYVLHATGMLEYVGEWKGMSPIETAIWEARNTYQKIASSERRGKGYSGGHHTATRLDWPAWTPSPAKGCVMYQDISRSGRFTGFYPKMRSYNLI